MATISTFVNKSRGTQLPATEVSVAQELIDCSVTNVSAGDLVRVINVPANSLVKKVYLKVNTAETGNVTLGDSSDVDGYATTLSIAATGTLLPQTSAAYTTLGGKFYSSADYITMSPDANLDSAALKVVAEIITFE